MKTPFVLKEDNVAFFDVDETLVLWDIPAGTNPADLIRVGNSDSIEHVLPHLPHIEQLKRHKARGHAVVVWSQGGYEWAHNVVKALGLEEFVDAIVRKPMWYWDDLPSSAFMGNPCYTKWDGKK